MFGIFQADLPIGRRIWLVALTLVITSLATGQPLKLLDDPARFAVAMLVFAGHAFLLGVLYSLAPTLIISVFELVAMNRRSRRWEATSILFEGYRFDAVAEPIVVLAVIVAAAQAAQRFGDQSLTTTGIIGLLMLLLAEILDIDELLSKRPNELLLELRSSGAENSVAQVFFDGELLAATTMDGDMAGSIARLLRANWKFLVGANQGADVAWLRRDVPGMGAAARLLKHRKAEIHDIRDPSSSEAASKRPHISSRKRRRRGQRA